MSRLYHDFDYRIDRMNQSEIEFAEIMKRKGKEVIFANKEQDMFEHWDVCCDGVKYDVKAQKKLNRSDDEESDVIWIELTNVRGDIGWIKGKADKIAFQTKEGFKIIDRENLFNFIVTFVPSTEVFGKKGYKQWYQRRYRKDVMTYVYPEDVDYLVEELL